MTDLMAHINARIRIAEGAGKNSVAISIDDARAIVKALEATE